MVSYVLHLFRVHSLCNSSSWEFRKNWTRLVTMKTEEVGRVHTYKKEKKVPTSTDFNRTDSQSITNLFRLAKRNLFASISHSHILGHVPNFIPKILFYISATAIRLFKWILVFFLLEHCVLCGEPVMSKTNVSHFDTNTRCKLPRLCFTIRNTCMQSYMRQRFSSSHAI